MSIERTYYCDAPDCEAHVRTASRYPISGLIVVTEHAGGAHTSRHFCSWDCVLRYASTFPPVERIPMDPDA